MTTCTPETLHRHADAVEHTAALGGWVDPTTGARHALTEHQCAEWAREAAALREAAYRMEEQR